MLRRRVARAFFPVVLGCLTSATAPAQLARYELGRRLRVFEETWEQADNAARARATPALVAATTAFFSLRLPAAAQKLDAARFALLSPEAPREDLAWQASLVCVPSRRLWDPGAGELSVQVQRLCDDDDLAPAKDARLRLALLQANKEAVAVEASLAEAEAGVVLKAGDLADGLVTLSCTVSAGGRTLGVISHPITCVRNLSARLAALAPRPTAPAADTDHDGATLRYLERLLAAAARGNAGETDLPYLRLLEDAEAVVRARQSGASFLASSPRGERWLCFALGKKRLPVRIHAPAADEPVVPRPLLILLHGAGGSENMFFDVYGAGTYVNRARELGWIVAAPNNAGDAAAPLVDALAAIYPVDRQRVYMVGHSMGAMQAIGVATGSAAPTFAAVAALGGGGSVPRSADLGGRRFFVATGAQDFARAGATALRAALARASATVTWQDYADTEHLTVVQRAAGDVFAWFEASGGKK